MADTFGWVLNEGGRDHTGCPGGEACDHRPGSSPGTTGHTSLAAHRQGDLDHLGVGVAVDGMALSATKGVQRLQISPRGTARKEPDDHTAAVAEQPLGLEERGSGISEEAEGERQEHRPEASATKGHCLANAASYQDAPPPGELQRSSDGSSPKRAPRAWANRPVPTPTSIRGSGNAVINGLSASISVARSAAPFVGASFSGPAPPVDSALVDSRVGHLPRGLFRHRRRTRRSSMRRSVRQRRA